MAQRDFPPSYAAREPGLNFRNLTNVAGAAISLALLLGVGVWSYKLVVRDVSGVPVVRAAEGPIRIQPENPGGKQAQHQGLSVNAVAAVGEASRPADRLILAPAPLSLSAEDTPVHSTKTAPQTTGVEAVEPAPRELTPQAESDDAVPTDTTQAQLASFSGGTVNSTDPQERPEQEAPSVVQTDARGPSQSLRPRLRPEQVTSVGEAVALQVAASQPVDPAAVLPGTGMAQLGSFDNEALARDAWIGLSARFSGYLDGKQQVIQAAESGGRRFYRLRALGFDDISDARRFCSALVAEGAECIPVVSR